MVGVISAFVISRLLDAQAEFDRVSRKTEELLLKANRLSDAAAARPFQWYVQQGVNNALSEVRERLKEPVQPPAAYYDSRRFPIFVSRDEAIKAIDDTIDEWLTEREDAARKKAEKEASSMSDPFRSLYRSIPEVKNGFRETSREREINEARNEVDALILEVKHHIRLIKRHINFVHGNPQKSSLVTGIIWALGFLFVVGIVYPLSFLPVSATGAPELGGVEAFLAVLFSLRGGLLALLSIVFGAVLLLLHRTNAKLVHPPHIFNNLVSAIKYGYYSKYLENMQAHEDWQNFLKGKSGGWGAEAQQKAMRKHLREQARQEAQKQPTGENEDPAN